MTNQHPITPPPELVQQWWEEADQYKADPKTYFDHVATQAARWGADQELDACCTWLSDHGYIAADPEIRAARRPKPPTLKEQAFTALHAIATGANDIREQHQDLDTIRKALEQLDDE